MKENHYWDSIVSCMDDKVCIMVCVKFAPRTKKAFLRRYLELAPGFQDLLNSEFSDGYIRAALVEKTYYFPIDYREFDIFGQELPVCIDYAECIRLARDYELDLGYFMSKMREATLLEIQIHGTYDAE